MKNFSAFITAHAKAIVAIWIVIFITMAVFAIQLPSKLHGDGFFVEADHTYVTNELAKTFDLPAETIMVVFDQTSNQKIENTLQKLEDIEEVHSIQSPLDDSTLQKNGISYAMVHFKNNIDNLPTIVKEVRALVEEEGISVTGGL